MLTYTELQSRYKDRTQDTSTENSNRGKERLNQVYRLLCTSEDYFWLEKEYTVTTVADQQSYDLPRDLRRITSVKVSVSNIDYIMDEISDPVNFDEINSQTDTVKSDFPTYYHIRENKVKLFPTPSTSGNTITILYIRRPIDLQNEDYTTGTISVTNGSTAVTGSGTTFTDITVNGNTNLIINEVAYEVDSITDATNLVLKQKYQGDTESGASYTLGDVPIIPDEFQDILWMGAVREYELYDRNDMGVYREVDQVFKEIEARMIRRGKSRGSKNVFSRRDRQIRTINNYPQSIG